jgi:hypothetical protein
MRKIKGVFRKNSLFLSAFFMTFTKSSPSRVPFRPVLEEGVARSGAGTIGGGLELRKVTGIEVRGQND